MADTGRSGAATTPDEFLDLEEARIRKRLSRAVVETGAALERAVDLPGLVRRRPMLSLGIGAVAGCVLGSAVLVGGRRVSRRTIRSIATPLLKPTIAGLGTALAGMLVGSPTPRD